MTSRPAPGKRPRITVLFGGKSPEHWVSFKSGVVALLYLDPSRYELEAVYVKPDGKFGTPADYRVALERFLITNQVPLFSPGEEPADWKDFLRQAAAPDGADLLQTLGQRDLIFPVFHGRGGEDGTIQALARRMGVRCAGASMEASALGMDKVLTKRIAERHGLAVAPWKEVTLSQWKANSAQLLETLPWDLGWPLFVKPARLGSSIGVSRASSVSELEQALTNALRYDNLVLVEQEIRSKEYSVGVVGRGGHYDTSVVAEFCMDANSFDYDSKYGPQAQDDIIPARLNAADTQTMIDFARKVAEALDIRGISRIDSFWGPQGPILNEVNTMPGLSAAAPFVISWEKAGVNKRGLMDKIVEFALTDDSTASAAG